MSRLTDKILKMKNMSDEELREYIKTLSDNDKNTLLFSFIKTFLSDENNFNIINSKEE